MRILIDGLSARSGGGVTRLVSLLRVLPEIAPQHDFFVLLSPKYQNQIINSLPNRIRPIPVTIRDSDLGSRTWFQNVSLPRVVQDLRIDGLYVSGESAYIRFPTTTVMLSGNLSLFSAPVGFSRSLTSLRLLLYRKSRFPLVRHAMQAAGTVAFVSEWMRDNVLKQIKLPLSKTMVLYHGLVDEFRQTEARLPRLLKVEQENSYILAVSSIAPHKGYETLIEAYARANDLCNMPPVLIVGSALHKPTLLSVQALIQRAGIGDKVHFMGAVRYDDLPQIYANACLFVLPTQLESFGLPLLEAMGTGLPIITSDLPICRELCQDAALYCPPGLADLLAEQMESAMKNLDLRRSLAECGIARAADFSWELTATRLISKLEELVRIHVQH